MITQNIWGSGAPQTKFLSNKLKQTRKTHKQNCKLGGVWGICKRAQNKIYFEKCLLIIWNI